MFLLNWLPTSRMSANSWQQSTISSPHLTSGKIQATKMLFLKVLLFHAGQYKTICVCVCEQIVKLNKSSIDISNVTVICLDSVIKHEHAARLPGRFCSALSQHHIIPLIWSHFAWLHPGRLPVGAQQGRQLDRRSLLYVKVRGLVVGWQDAGNVRHWEDLLSLVWLSPGLCWLVVLKEVQASSVLVKAVTLLYPEIICTTEKQQRNFNIVSEWLRLPTNLGCTVE